MQVQCSSNCDPISFVVRMVAFATMFFLPSSLLLIVTKAIMRAAKRDVMKTELMQDEYYRMEAKRRHDKKGLG